MNQADANPMDAAAWTDDEARLLTALRAGDDLAFERLVRDHSGRMLAVAQRFLRNSEDARDVVQEAFIAAFRSLNSFEGSARLSTWLHRIVINAALMKLRSRRRVPEDSIEDLLPKFLEDGHQVHPSREWRRSSEEMMQDEQTRGLVRSCIERLPEAYRTVLILRDLEELDTQEAATLLGITENAVKIRLHRARQALRGLLDPHFRGGGA